jgi:hypothetical protein
MEAPWIVESEVPSRGLSRKRSRPSLLERVLPGASDGRGGDGVSAGADALRPAEENAAGNQVRWPTRRGSTRRESERFGGAGRRKPLRVVNGTGFGCSSSEKRIGGLQTLVIRAWAASRRTLNRRSDRGSIVGRSYSVH